MPIFGPLGGAAGILQESGPSPYPVGLGPIMGAGIGGYMQAAPLDEYQRRQQQLQQSLGGISKTLGWQSTAAPLAQAHGIPMSYLNKLASSESGNRNIATGIAPSSGVNTAFGPFQFTSGSWNNVAQSNPALGLRPEDRFNERAQGGAVVALTAANRNALTQSLGRQPTWGETHLAHVFGASGAAKLLQSPRGEMLRNILPDAVAHNPQWQDSSVGSIIDQHSKEFDNLGKVRIQLASLGTENSEARDQASQPTQGTSNLSDILGLLQERSQKQDDSEPLGSAIQNITPQMREILSIALQDPVLGPHALQGLIAAGLSRSKTSSASGGTKLPEDFQKWMIGQAVPEYGATLGKSKDEMTAAYKDLVSAGLDPNSPEFKQAMLEHIRNTPEAAAAAAQAATQMQMEKFKTMAPTEYFFNEWKGVLGRRAAAEDQLSNISQLQDMLSRVHTDKFAGAKMKVAQVFNALKVSPDIQRSLGFSDQVGDMEAFDATRKFINMQLRDPRGGGGMPGQMSNYEDKLLQSMGPELQKSMEGNQLILAYMQKREERLRDYAKWAAQYQKKDKNLENWTDASYNWVNDHPILDQSFRQKIADITHTHINAPNDDAKTWGIDQKLNLGGAVDPHGEPAPTIPPASAIGAGGTPQQVPAQPDQQSTGKVYRFTDKPDGGFTYTIK